MRCELSLVDDCLYRLPEVEALTGKKRSQIYQHAAAGKFPKPIKIGVRSSAWLGKEIRAWKEGCIAASRSSG